MVIGPRLAGCLMVSLCLAGCAPGAPEEEERFGRDDEAYSVSNTMVGDWSALPNGVECLVGMQAFYPGKFGVWIPTAPSSWYGDCGPEGACHLWLDAQPNPAVWERIEYGSAMPSTYDLAVYPPSGSNIWGHVAGVDHVENGQIYVMDVNFVGYHVRSSSPHTIDRAPYGFYHLRSLPKDDGAGYAPPPADPPPSGGNGGCAGLNDALYCGENYVSGDPGTLYRCQGGDQYVHEVCAYGCQPMPNGSDDVCAAAPAPPPPSNNGGCAGFYNGYYCGGNYIAGDADTLYVCENGNLSVAEVCAYGCAWMPPGYDDYCY